MLPRALSISAQEGELTMATHDAQSGAASSALVRHDPRPFLVQAIDRCLELGTWTTIDLDQFAIDIVNMGFRYLDRLHRDRRDLDAVGDATEAVLMYIDDGLRMISGQDLDLAAAFLGADEQPLSKAFNQSWRTWDRLQQEARALLDGIREIHIGPPGSGLRIGSLPQTILHFGSDRGTDDYTPDALLATWRSGRSVASLRAQFRDGIALARLQHELLMHLPFDEVQTRCHELLLVEGTFDVAAQVGFGYDVAWASALIRTVMRGDVGLVVTVDELERFLINYLRIEWEGTEDEHTVVCDEAVNAAVRVLAPSLTAALAEPAASVVEGIRYALNYAVGVILNVVEPAGGADDDDEEGGDRGARVAPRSGRWFIEWATRAVFLVVSSEERTRAVEAVVTPMDRDELIARFEGTTEEVAATQRVEILRQLDVAVLPIADVVRLLSASSNHAKDIIQRAELTRRTIRELDELACALPELTSEVVATAILTAGCDLSRLSDDAVFALLLWLPSTRSVSRMLLHRVHMDPERLLHAFRKADDREQREEWVRLAAASGEHLSYLIGDVRETPRFARDIVEVFRVTSGDSGRTRILPEYTANCFLEAERAVRAKARRWRKRAFLSERGELVLLDPDLRWLWPRLPPHQQDPVRAAFRKADRLAKRPHAKTKPAKPSKKTKRLTRTKKKPTRARRNTRH